MHEYKSYHDLIIFSFFYCIKKYVIIYNMRSFVETDIECVEMIDENNQRKIIPQLTKCDEKELEYPYNLNNLKNDQFMKYLYKCKNKDKDLFFENKKIEEKLKLDDINYNMVIAPYMYIFSVAQLTSSIPSEINFCEK